MNYLRCARFPKALLGVAVLWAALAGAAGCSNPTSPEPATDSLDQSQPTDTAGGDASADQQDTRPAEELLTDSHETTVPDLSDDLADAVQPADLEDLSGDSTGADLDTADSPDVCVPQCTGKECGDDGCGGTCGICPFAAPVCSDQGLCQLDCPQSECTFGETTCTDGAEMACDQPCAAPTGCQECWNWRMVKVCPAGSACDQGVCTYEQDCTWAAQQHSQLGCSFLAVDLPVYADPYATILPSTAAWGVQLLNPFPYPAVVSFADNKEGSTWSTEPVELCGGCQTIVELPTRTYNQTSITLVTVQITSTSPIAVVQVNPFDVDAASNSTALLWPTHVGGTDFWGTTQPTVPLEQFPLNMASQFGYLGAISLETGPNTLNVTLQAKTTMFALSGDMFLPYQEEYSLPINQNEWFVASASGANGAAPYDLSGSHIVSDKPIQVYGGHEEGAICGDPNASESCCADAMSEQLLPTARWGTEYVVVKAPIRSSSDKDVIHIQAGSQGATLTTVPAIVGLQGMNLAPGQRISAAYATSFLLTATQPVQAVQYLAGKMCVASEVGDPAMATMMPASAGTQLLAAAPLEGYPQQYVVLVKKGLSKVWENGVEMDGQAWAEVSSSGYFTVAVSLDEFKKFECDGPCTAYAYGYASTAGYAHPLGASFPQ